MSQATRASGAITVSEPESVEALLCRHGIDPASRHIAVAVNGAVVRRLDWASHLLRTGDQVEIVRPFQGG